MNCLHVCAIYLSIGINKHFLHKWLHLSCDMTSSIIFSLSVLNIWCCGGEGGGSGSPETKLSTVMRCPSKVFYTVHMLGTLGFTGSEHWAPFNFPQSTALESVRINGVTVLSGLNLERIQGLSFPMANQTVHSYEMFIFGGYPQSRVWM